MTARGNSSGCSQGPGSNSSTGSHCTKQTPTSFPAPSPS